MNISNVGSTSPLLKQLQTNGLSAAKANLVQSDLASSQGTVLTGTATTGLTPSARSAFDAKISADVLSGKLSASDAAAVKKTMDNLDGGSTTAAAAGQGSAGASTASGSAATAKAGGGGAGGGGGGSSNKTELSESVTISGSTMTTVITYTDGTTSSTTTTATDADKAKYEKAESGDTARAASKEYAPSIDKGALVDQVG